MPEVEEIIVAAPVEAPVAAVETPVVETDFIDDPIVEPVVEPVVEDEEITLTDEEKAAAEIAAADAAKAVTPPADPIKAELERIGYTFKADGTPVPPASLAPAATPAGDASFYPEPEGLDAEPALPPEVISARDTLLAMDAAEMAQDDNWREVAFLQYQATGTRVDPDTLNDGQWGDVKARYLNEMAMARTNRATQVASMRESIGKINNYRNELANHAVIKQVPEALVAFDALVAQIRGRGDTPPSEIAENLDFLRNAAIGAHVMKVQDAAKALGRKENAAHTKVLGVQPTLTAAEGTALTPELADQARAAGLDPKTDAKYMAKEFVFSF